MPISAVEMIIENFGKNFGDTLACRWAELIEMDSRLRGNDKGGRR